MAENSKLHSGTASQSHSFDFVGFNKVDTLKMATPDSETSPERNERSDSFVVDMESLCRGIDKDVTANSRITLQRNLSRKGSQRGERRITATLSPINISEKAGSINTTSATGDVSPSKAAGGGSMRGSIPPEKSVIVAVESTEPATYAQMMNTSTATSTENNYSRSNSINISVSRRQGSRRSSTNSGFVVDPRSVVILFATLSSMGTILLIFFTLSINNNLSGDDFTHSQ
ncbi:PREDICTED: uncharacterized protein LOC104604898 [Nelumbo nucifera]|uniref:Uncharacterized protein LOC104604898 n=1 Tax=Nelumbo nucifera TaxID=4432 RepID=A0A1U8AXJ0_NELNU|nr:PREDICTED: uncharacterized protein LOC104604898 [Nelumbo nucifera]